MKQKRCGLTADLMPQAERHRIHIELDQLLAEFQLYPEGHDYLREDREYVLVHEWDAVLP